MTKERKLKILEDFRLSTELFNSEDAKKSFYEVYKNLSEEALLDIEKALKNGSK